MTGGERGLPKTTHSGEVSEGEGGEGGGEKGGRRGRERGRRVMGREGEFTAINTEKTKQGYLIVVVAVAFVVVTVVIVCGVKYKVSKGQKLSLESAINFYCTIWKQMRRLSA